MVQQIIHPTTLDGSPVTGEPKANGLLENPDLCKVKPVAAAKWTV